MLCEDPWKSVKAGDWNGGGDQRRSGGDIFPASLVILAIMSRGTDINMIVRRNN